MNYNMCTHIVVLISVKKIIAVNKLKSKNPFFFDSQTEIYLFVYLIRRFVLIIYYFIINNYRGRLTLGDCTVRLYGKFFKGLKPGFRVGIFRFFFFKN